VNARSHIPDKGNQMPFSKRIVVVALVFGLGPTAALAQTTSIAGVVTDTSGAVIPGVTVEAASPALIEGARAATTDASGHYSIVELRPGTYVVTFTLAGFNTVKREASSSPPGSPAT
jgi:hypothetical protein